jgi:hypothetical protein
VGRSTALKIHVQGSQNILDIHWHRRKRGVDQMSRGIRIPSQPLERSLLRLTRLTILSQLKAVPGMVSKLGKIPHKTPREFKIRKETCLRVAIAMGGFRSRAGIAYSAKVSFNPEAKVPPGC